jgi:hypothetical protein
MKKKIIITTSIVAVFAFVELFYKNFYITTPKNDEPTTTASTVANMFNKSTTMVAIEQQKNPNSVVLATTATDNHSSMKLYRNEQFGFEYQYPQNLTFEAVDFPKHSFFDTGEVCKNLVQKDAIPRRLLHQTTLSDPSSKFKVVVVTVNVYDNSNRLSLNDWLNSGTKFLENHREECQYDDENLIEIRLGFKKTVSVDGTAGIQGFSGCCEESDKNIYLANGGKIYNLTFSGDVNTTFADQCEGNIKPFSDNESACPYLKEEVYNQILSTFKFLKK